MTPAATDVDRPDSALLDALRDGSEEAFSELVAMHGASMLRVARAHVGDAAVAEEVVQETWLRVLQGLDGFEGRASLRTWIFVILGHCAARRARLEDRSVAFSVLGPEEPAEPASSFFPDDHPRWPGCWSTQVGGWADAPDDRLVSRETQDVIRRALQALPEGQRVVMTLRDVEGYEADEVCAVLDISPANQRVLLHRARAQVRAALTRYLGQGDG